MTSKYSGYMGKMLDVDLTSQTIGEYNISDRDRELFIGGRYLSTKILWDELPEKIDPLSHENILVVMTSPLTGTGAPSTSRYDISAKSPLTGAIGHSNSGGNFGIHLKRAGFDGIIVRGKSEKKVYLEINNSDVKIKNGEELWGLDTQEAQEKMGEKGGKLVIGPAGEKLIKFASVVSQERSHGRTGMGAVMGSKNLKGFYDYPAKPKKKHLWAGLKDLYPQQDADEVDIQEIKNRFHATIALEAARCVEEGVVVDVREADIGSILGFGFAPFTGGAISYIDGMGSAAFVDMCKKLQKKYGKQFKPNKLLLQMAKENENFYDRFNPYGEEKRVA